MHKYAAVTALFIALITMLTPAVSALLTPLLGSPPYRHEPRGWHLEFRRGLFHRSGLIRASMAQSHTALLAIL
jgi:hypothetical protein